MVSRAAVTVSPVLVVVAAMQFNTTSWLVRGRPRQFMLMWANSRCSMRFHFDVPGGSVQTVTARPLCSANAASSVLKDRRR